MDNYLCRGKRFDDGEFVEGYLFVSKLDGAYILQSYLTKTSVKNDLYTREEFVRHKVDPSTAGRCSGLKDKNGWLIYEGDILVISTVNLGEKRLVEVCFGRYEDVNHSGEDGFLGWSLRFGNEHITVLTEQRSGWTMSGYVEIVGNIYDNPELLKGDYDAAN